MLCNLRLPVIHHHHYHHSMNIIRDASLKKLQGRCNYEIRTKFEVYRPVCSCLIAYLLLIPLRYAVDNLSVLYTAYIVLTAAVVLVYKTNHLIVG